MEHFALTLGLFVLGAILVVKGGDFFVDAAGWIARSFGIPAFIIGATIVSIATTLPEMIVSIIAAADGKADMSIGNAVGSVTANTGIIMALAILFMSISVPRKTYALSCMLLSASATVLWAATLSGTLSFWGSVLLFGIFLTFMLCNLKTAKKAPLEQEESTPVEKHQLVRNICLFILGAAGIIVGSQLLVNSGSGIAATLGVPERIIAVTLIAIGTSLPELVTTVTAIVKKESHLSVGNIIGANIIDLTLILPLSSIASGGGLPISTAASSLDMPVCLGIILLGVIPMLIWEKTFKWQGMLMLLAYLAYLATLI